MYPRQGKGSLRRGGALALFALLVAAPGAMADRSSLIRAPGPKPGPAILYAKPPAAPQLTNRGPWRARPILVSGTTAYRRGEFLYQDYLYDDTGARLASDPGDPRSPSNLFSEQNGTYLYPTAGAYANNAADIVEMRVKPLRRATAFRLTLNTLKKTSLVAFSIALGGRPDRPRPFPFGANVSAPATRFLTVHPRGSRMIGELTKAGSGRRIGRPLRVRVDKRRRQIQVLIPRRRWNPKRRTVRIAAGVGLWDAAAGRYLLPAPSRDESTPGGGGGDPSPAAFFNVAFRTGEPVQGPDESTAALTNPAWWRDRAQAAALTAGDISPFFARVSFRKLARRVRDNSAVPKTGAMNRIYASRFELSQGVDFGHSCLAEPATCPGQYQGRLQPYAIYVPRRRAPRGGFGLTLLLHSLSANYNQYLGSRQMRQYAERGRGSIVITPEARGPDEFYENYGAADVFEVWADVARRFRLDPGWTVTTGYSMGGIGSFKLAAQFPDLFARIHSTVGREGETSVLASLRNVPVLMWNNHGDELVNDAWFTETANALDALGYRYELDAFQPCASPSCSPLFPNHLQLAVNDQYAPGASFLGTARVVRNPMRVTYVVAPQRNHPELKLVGDHAYWVSGIRLRRDATEGIVDAQSNGFGRGNPPASPTRYGLGTLAGGNLGTLTYDSRLRRWGPAPRTPRRNRLRVRAEGVAAMTVDVRRARLNCRARFAVETDGPLTIRLRGCDRKVVRGR